MLSRDPRHLARIQEIDKLLLEQSVPDIFDDGDARSVTTIARKQLLRLCAALSAAGINNPQELTLLNFHSQVEFLSEKYGKDKTD